MVRGESDGGGLLQQGDTGFILPLMTAGSAHGILTDIFTSVIIMATRDHWLAYMGFDTARESTWYLMTRSGLILLIWTNRRHDMVDFKPSVVNKGGKIVVVSTDSSRDTELQNQIGYVRTAVKERPSSLYPDTTERIAADYSQALLSCAGCGDCPCRR